MGTCLRQRQVELVERVAVGLEAEAPALMQRLVLLIQAAAVAVPGLQLVTQEMAPLAVPAS